jgi:protocatechuate 3,4-dioxygenase, alpha subunit
MDLTPTPSQTVGPFFHFGLTTERHCIKCMARPGTKGERVWLTFRVIDGDGVPLNDAMIEIWQANSEGKYNHPDDKQEKSIDSEFLGFGRLGTAEDGSCEFETIKPGRVPGPGNALQAPHFDLAVFARGMPKQLYTRVYFAGEPVNSDDPMLALVPPSRRKTLLAEPDVSRAGHWHLDIHLQGAQETVFFDV